MNSDPKELDNFDYVEAIVVMSPSGDRDRVEKWFTDRTFKCLQMRSGFLATGDRAKLERVFNVKIGGLSEHIDLPIPKELAGNVISISIPKLPEYGTNTSRG